MLSRSRLGISILHERAAEIGADLAIDSAPGMGTQVFLVWNEAAQPTTEFSVRIRAMATSEQPIRVIVVDDHPMMRNGIKAYLAIRAMWNALARQRPARRQ